MTADGKTAAGLVERIFEACLGAFDVYSMYLGDRLGYYRALAEEGAVTSAELAQATGTDERYAREWLEQQAVTGLLGATTEGGTSRFELSPSFADVLVHRDHDDFLAPAVVQVASAAFQLPAVADAFRSGGGVVWEQYGFDMRDSQGEMNRNLFLKTLGGEWLPQIPAVHEALSGEGARVADIGCGYGWSSIGIAHSYPSATVDGFDVDEPSIRAATEHAAEAGVAERVSFHTMDGSGAGHGDYDLVIALECIHDMSDPVSVLGGMRRMAGDSGTVLVVDERTADSFTAPGDEMERFFYGFSITTCLPDGMFHQPSVGTGTVMRTETLRGYAQEAGFSEVAVLPIEHEQFRIYHLVD